MSYAIISVAGKQYRVREGERLLVHRLRADEGTSFQPDVLLADGDGTTVTAKVVGHVLGEKVRIGKYRPKSGYRRHAGHRSRLTQIEIESIGGGSRSKAKREPKQEATAPAAPEGYAELKVSEVAEWTKGRRLPTIEAALTYEEAHASRKGAIAALNEAIAKRKGEA